METFSVLLAICAGNSPLTSEFPAQRPVAQSFGVFFDLRRNKAGFILHASVYARIRQLSAQLFCRQLCPAYTCAYADCRRQSSNMLNFQGQRRPAQAFQPITKALQGHQVTEGRCVVLHRDIYGRIPTHTLTCLYFYPRRNLRYAVAMHRQPQAWTSARAAGCRCGIVFWPRGKMTPGQNTI